MASRKAHRSSRACETCNKRKIKCRPHYGGTDCEACVENGLECVPRTRKKRQSSSSTQPSRAQNITAATANTISGPHSDIARSSEVLHTESIATPHTFHSFQPRNTRSCDPDAISHPAGTHAWYEDTISRLVSDVQDVQPQGTPGTNSGNVLQSEVPALVAHDNGPNTNLHFDERGDLLAIEFQILQLRKCFDLPPRSIREGLIDTFMLRCWPWTPIIERGWLDEGQGRTVSLILIQAVFLAASRVSSSPSVAAFATPREFYQRAKCLFWTGHEQDALMNIRAACILNWYIPHGPEHVSFDTSKFWINIAVGLAHQINLHKEPPPGQTRIMRRRLWWSLVVRDNLLSASHGRPRGINLEDCDVAPPSLDDFPESNLQGHLFIHYVKVVSLLGDLTEYYSGRPSSRHYRLFVQTSMSNWTRDLPEELQLFHTSSTSAQHRLAPYSFNARQLHVPYFVVLTIMHKSMTPSTGPSAVALLAASYIAGIYEDFLARDEVQYLPAIFSFYGFAAAVSLFSFYKYSYLRDSLKQDLDVIMNAEQELGKRWPAARGMRNALENMASFIPSAVENAFSARLEIPRLEVNSYLSSFGPGLCRVWDVVSSQEGLDLQVAEGSDHVTIPAFDLLPSSTAVDNMSAPGDFSNRLGNAIAQEGEGVELDNGFFGFQRDDIGYWLLDNSVMDFQL